VIVLETRGLTRRFGDLLAVDDLNIQVESGSTFGLLGSNGAGKTTAIKMLTTLLPPTSGAATVAGFDIRRQPGRVRVIGYVPQMISAEAALTGYEILLIFAKLYDLPRRERAAASAMHWRSWDSKTPPTAVIWERDLGTIHKLLVSPTPRAALMLGIALSAGIRSLSQVVIIYLLALLSACASTGVQRACLASSRR
jgi:ABC-2 type transport system ATP-binding protein